jgi:hypothetical protein
LSAAEVPEVYGYDIMSACLTCHVAPNFLEMVIATVLDPGMTTSCLLPR